MLKGTFFTAAGFPEIKLRIYKRCQQLCGRQFLESVFQKHGGGQMFNIAGSQFTVCDGVIGIALFQQIAIRFTAFLLM